MHQKELNNYHVFSGGDHDLMLIPVNAAYAMLLAGNELATQKKVLGTVRSMLAVRDEVKKALKQMGVAPVISDTDNFEQKTPEFTGPVSKDSSDEIDTLIKKKMKKVSTGELEAYWDDAALKQKNVPTNPDVITYDQARKLGLNPGEAE